VSAAFRSHGRGTPILRMSFKGVGLIERATGFADPAMLPRLKEMCRVLYGAGKDELLRDVKAGRLTLRQVWEVYRTGQWTRLPTPQHALPFADQFTAWRATKSARYARYAAWVATALGPIGTLAELRAVCLRYRAACETAGTGAMFNHVLATVRAFLRDTVTIDHALYADVRAIARLSEPVKRPKQPQRPEQAAAIRAALGGELGRVWWILCCTGMLPDEFFAGKWAIEDGRLHVKGTKREARDRFVPLLTDVAPSPLKPGYFQAQLRKSGLGVRPKDGRDSFALWCELARVPIAWKRAVMGHAAIDVDMEYGWQESERIVDEVGGALRALLAPVGQSGGQPAAPSGPSADAPTPKPRSAILTPAQAAA